MAGLSLRWAADQNLGLLPEAFGPCTHAAAVHSLSSLFLNKHHNHLPENASIKDQKTAFLFEGKDLNFNTKTYDTDDT